MLLHVTNPRTNGKAELRADSIANHGCSLDDSPVIGSNGPNDVCSDRDNVV